MPCSIVANFCSEGKVMLLLSMVRYQVYCAGLARSPFVLAEHMTS